jgi:hypothetical protein
MERDLVLALDRLRAYVEGEEEKSKEVTEYYALRNEYCYCAHLMGVDVDIQVLLATGNKTDIKYTTEKNGGYIMPDNTRKVSKSMVTFPWLTVPTVTDIKSSETTRAVQASFTAKFTKGLVKAHCYKPYRMTAVSSAPVWKTSYVVIKAEGEIHERRLLSALMRFLRKIEWVTGRTLYQLLERVIDQQRENMRDPKSMKLSQMFKKTLGAFDIKEADVNPDTWNVIVYKKTANKYSVDIMPISEVMKSMDSIDRDIRKVMLNVLIDNSSVKASMDDEEVAEVGRYPCIVSNRLYINEEESIRIDKWVKPPEELCNSCRMATLRIHVSKMFYCDISSLGDLKEMFYGRIQNILHLSEDYPTLMSTFMHQCQLAASLKRSEISMELCSHLLGPVDNNEPLAEDDDEDDDLNQDFVARLFLKNKVVGYLGGALMDFGSRISKTSSEESPSEQSDSTSADIPAASGISMMSGFVDVLAEKDSKHRDLELSDSSLDRMTLHSGCSSHCREFIKQAVMLNKHDTNSYKRMGGVWKAMQGWIPINFATDLHVRGLLSSIVLSVLYAAHNTKQDSTDNQLVGQYYSSMLRDLHFAWKTSTQKPDPQNTTVTESEIERMLTDW